MPADGITHTFLDTGTGCASLPRLPPSMIGLDARVSHAEAPHPLCETLAEAPVRYFNGRDNDWRTPPAETRHL
jgi:hypothetical protein